MIAYVQLTAILLFIFVHLFAGKLRFLNVIPRSMWLSMAGGTSVAYVFMHLLPELHRAELRLATNISKLPGIQHKIYLVALSGLVVFYGLERLIRSAQLKRGESPGNDDGETTTGIATFWLHISFFAFYNLLIGYLFVHRLEQDFRGMIFFAIAMLLHFMVNDFGLRQDHKNTYLRYGRWTLAFAVFSGWLLGVYIDFSYLTTDMLFAFIAGSVILNVLKEELPTDRQSHFWAFASGTAIYTFFLLFLR
jgi:hypothetical protein